MWGSIIGDLAGSTYEFNQCRKVSSVEVKDIILDNSFYSDDTILTIAILDAMLNDKNYEYYLKKYAKEYMNYSPSITPYFKRPFSPNFIKWVNGNGLGMSAGNGAMMRISSVGYLCNSEEEVKRNVIAATIPSHNCKEAIDCALIVAMIIYLARKGYSKEDIIARLNLKYSYCPFEEFNYTCGDTIDNCLYALFTSDSFDDSIRKIISYGGDTDTNACIVGSMAEALYGIDDSLIDKAKKKIPDVFVKKLDKGYSLIKRCN